jgi:hypothetical protein
MDDVEAIKQLEGRCCRGMDTKDWAAMDFTRANAR